MHCYTFKKGNYAHLKRPIVYLLNLLSILDYFGFFITQMPSFLLVAILFQLVPSFVLVKAEQLQIKLAILASNDKTLHRRAMTMSIHIYLAGAFLVVVPSSGTVRDQTQLAQALRVVLWALRFSL